LTVQRNAARTMTISPEIRSGSLSRSDRQSGTEFMDCHVLFRLETDLK
jgi:hypothetical protein